MGLRLRRGGRRALEGVLYWSGAAAAYRRLHPTPGATVLMYHSVAGPEAAPFVDPRSRIAPERFAQQVDFLARHRRVVSMGELVEQLVEGEPAPAGTVAITFDDGYRDNLDTAAEILAARGLPATLYLATGYVSRGETQWVDRLYTAFARRTREMLSLRELGDAPRDLRQPRERAATYAALSRRLLAGDREARESLLRELAAQLAPDAVPPRLTLTWEEVGALCQRHAGFDIGVHSRDHVDLAACPPEVAEREITGCKRDAEDALGRPVAHFSYPYGRSNRAVRAVVAASGYRSAAVTEPADLVRPGGDRFALPRVEAPHSLTRLRFVTSGAHPGLARALWGRS